MPPSAHRRGRAKKQVEVQARSDAEDGEAAVTPGRKRRKVNNNSTSQPAKAASNSRASAHSGLHRKTRSSDIKHDEEEPRDLSEEEVDAVIRTLGKAKYAIQARVDHANEVYERQHPQGKQAYAKIAGLGWTFYVTDLEVRIGRPPDERTSSAQQASDPESHRMNDKSLVHIDLGPSKWVSRQHAEIRYNDNTGEWYIFVNGRNGIKLDETPLGRGQPGRLRSGSVIEIAGTQMMFVTPNETPVIHPTILAQSQARREENDEDDEEDLDETQPPSNAQRTPTRGGGFRSGPGHRPSSSQNQFSGHGKNQGRPAPTNAATNLTQNDGPADPTLSSGPAREPGSPKYSKGMMIESTEDIDYSLDTAKDLKPPHSYAQLIGMAILSSPEEKLTLSKIYDWIKERYAFYRYTGGGWQNSIRHNLSLNKCFEKIARRTDEPGKGMKWQIVQEHRDEFLKKGLSNTKKGAGRGSSAPTSPIKDGVVSRENDGRFDNLFSHSMASRPANLFLKTSPGSTPPMGTYAAANQAYTPDRLGGAHNRFAGPDISSPRNDFANGISPFPYSARNRFGGLTAAAAAGTPGGPAMTLGSDPNDHLLTPLITRRAPTLAPPSAAKLPSHFMPLSSPAPFWKYASEFGLGSTPARGGPPQGTYLGLGGMSPLRSPLKEQPEAEEKANDERAEQSGDTDAPADAQAPIAMPSSPPLPEIEVGQESPTRALSSRGGGSQSQQPIRPPQQTQQLPQYPSSAHNPPQINRNFNFPPHAAEDSDEEEVTMDLARGFQPIGSFHSNLNAGIIRGI